MYVSNQFSEQIDPITFCRNISLNLVSSILLGLFKNVWCVLDTSKNSAFWRIRYGLDNYFGESIFVSIIVRK